jgi:UPF0716 family protein affecting phage T7 exclusion
VLTHSIVAGYLYFLPFVPSFLVTLVSSLLLIHPPPRAHIRRAAASRSLIPVPWCGRSKKGKKKKKEGKQSKKGKKGNKKRERPPHNPSGTREPIRLGEGVLRHNFSWLASLLGYIVHTLVAISP